ncbi:MAG: hypothetical protein LQ339_007577 [Xanthoria mediterranea]|nr:MAG: hypothetical protein LQ339_007577 [Xanthoria mediterranea]
MSPKVYLYQGARAKGQSKAQPNPLVASKVSRGKRKLQDASTSSVAAPSSTRRIKTTKLDTSVKTPTASRKPPTKVLKTTPARKTPAGTSGTSTGLPSLQDTSDGVIDENHDLEGSDGEPKSNLPKTSIPKIRKNLAIKADGSIFIGVDLQQIEATRKAERPVNAVLLVGGFGENSYLHKRLCDLLEGEDIEVHKPAYGWTAVVRGTLLYGLNKHSPRGADIAIAGRYTGAYYSTESGKKFFSAANSRWEVNTYDWFYEKKLNNITITIVQYLDPGDHGPPIFVGDGDVTIFGTLEVPLSEIPTRNLKKRRSENGQEWFIVDFLLKIIRTSAEFEFTLMHNRKAYKNVKADFA